MSRLAAAVLLTATAGLATVTLHHHKRGPGASSATLAEVVPLRASRAQERLPLPGVNTHTAIGEGVTSTRRAPVRQDPSRPALGSGTLADVTMYCATGNRNAAGFWPQLGDVAVIDRSIAFGTRLLIAGREYVVRDWIGSGSQFDIFGGDDDGCEQRALDFGRQHLRVEVVR